MLYGKCYMAACKLRHSCALQAVLAKQHLLLDAWMFAHRTLALCHSFVMVLQPTLAASPMAGRHAAAVQVQAEVLVVQAAMQRQHLSIGELC